MNPDIDLEHLRTKFIEKVSQGVIFYKQPFFPCDVNYIFECIDKAKQLDEVRQYLTTNWYLLSDGVRWTLQSILKVEER